jgi:hypothetical protein
MNLNKNSNPKWFKTQYLGVAAGVALVAASAAGISSLRGNDSPGAEPASAVSTIKLSPPDNRVSHHVILGSQEEADRLREQILLDTAYWESTTRYYFYAITNEAEEQAFAAQFADADGPFLIQDLRFPPLPAIKDGMVVEQSVEATAPRTLDEQLRALARQPQFGTAADAEYAAQGLIATQGPPQAIPDAANVPGDPLSSAERIAELAKRPGLPAVLYLHVVTSQLEADHLRSALSTEAAHFGANAYTGSEVVLVDDDEANAALNTTINDLQGQGIWVVVVEPRAP